MRRACVLACVALVLTACSSGTEVDASRIVVTPGALTFATVGRTQEFRAALVTGSDTVTNRDFVWSSNDPSVAAVAGAGTSVTVTARKSGTATIAVSLGSLRANVTVTVALVAASLSKLTGDRQYGTEQVVLGQPLVVFARDSGGSPVPGAQVVFAVADGGGGALPAEALTGPDGRGSTQWRLGSGASHRLTATHGSLPPVEFTATSLPAPAPGFQITLVNIGGWFTPEVQAALSAATTYWQSAITGDVADVTGFFMQEGTCGSGSPALSATVDDVIILVDVRPIDGAGRVLGSAGPCYFRQGSTSVEQTLAGIMMFDSDDVAGLAASGQLDAVIRHEMAHVLGFGPLWPASVGPTAGFGCLQEPSSASLALDTYYSCPRGRAVFDSIGGTSYTGGNRVPLENCAGIQGCGAGTYNSHWRESAFANELMTGYLNTGTANPVSALTLAALQDLGYVVDLSAAEPYSGVFTAPPALRGPLLALGDDAYRGPVHGVRVERGVARRTVRLR